MVFLKPLEGCDAVTYEAVGVNCKEGSTTEIKAQVPRIIRTEG